MGKKRPFGDRPQGAELQVVAGRGERRILSFLSALLYTTNDFLAKAEADLLMSLVFYVEMIVPKALSVTFCDI